MTKLKWEGTNNFKRICDLISLHLREVRFFNENDMEL